MGQTLENGVYLPSEGERNCYAGLKTNWEILDQKVADVTALQQAVAGALHREIVESLPTTDINPNTIYMVLSGTSATENVYNEYMYVNNAWELIGTSATDLTNYYTKGEIDGKLLLKANASDLTSHTGDTTIHVTTADKTTWNTVASKANDSDVVHKSGNETVGGIKSFSDDTFIKSLNFTNEVASASSSSSAIMPLVTTVTYTDQTASKVARINLRITASGDKSLYPHENNQYALGLTSRKWSEVHGVTYYYGSSDTEFSDKFVTTDTAQTIASNKTFVGSQYFKDNNVQYFGIDFSKGTAPSAYTARCTYFSPLTDGGSTYQTSNGLVGCAVSSDNVVTTFMHAIKNTAGATTRTSFVLYYDTDNDKRSVTTNGDFLPISSGQGIGNSTSKWTTINGLNPSSLGMPDLSNGIDISSYITHLDKVVNSYTPPANGYITIRVKKTSLPIISIRIQQYYGLMNSSETADFSTWGTCLPVVAGNAVEVYISADSLMSAIFFPCQGNV